MEVYGQLQPNDAATDVIRPRRQALATSEPSGLAPRCRPHGSQDAATTPSEMRCRAAATGATRCATTTSARTAGASAWCSPSCRCCRRTATRPGSSRRSVWTRSRCSLPERPRPSHEGDPILLDNVSTHSSRAVERWLARHPRVKLLFGARYSPNHNPVERVWGAMKRHLANSATLTMPGRLQEVHTFFRSRTRAQMLATASPFNTPWLPPGYGQKLWKAAFRQVTSWSCQRSCQHPRCGIRRRGTDPTAGSSMSRKSTVYQPNTGRRPSPISARRRQRPMSTIDRRAGEILRKNVRSGSDPGGSEVDRFQPAQPCLRRTGSCACRSTTPGLSLPIVSVVDVVERGDPGLTRKDRLRQCREISGSRDHLCR